MNYRKTLLASYLGFITQAITANFVPLLFLTFQREFNISTSQIALISTVFFITQLIIDFLCAKFVDKIGYRKCVVMSEVFAASGLIGLAFIPQILPNPYIGILICVVVYAMGSGLIEVLVSPIVEACPFENKSSVMSLLHSFYCWGTVGVIVVSTVFFAIFGIDNWRIMACIWAILPLYNIFNFATCPIERLVDDGEGYGIKKLISMPIFWVAIILMICAGASEISMGQWASAYVESALGFSKTIGDLMGPCLFAVAMGISRTIYGKYGEKIDLIKFMIGSGILCLCCYLLSAFSIVPVMGLVGCIICGFSVGIMWPGTISITSVKIPLGGTAMFALLALSGDLGGSIGPYIVGIVSQSTGDNLKMGLLAGSVFPVVLVISAIIMKRENKGS